MYNSYCNFSKFIIISDIQFLNHYLHIIKQLKFYNFAFETIYKSFYKICYHVTVNTINNYIDRSND